MNDSFNILIFSKDHNQGTIIQDSIKAAGYDSQVFDQEEAAYEGFLSRNFTLCIIDHDMDRKETRTLAAMIKSSENIIPVIFLCEHPTREEIALLFSFHADDVIRKPLDAEILQARIKAIQNRYRPQNKKRGKNLSFRKIQIRLVQTTLVHRRQNNQTDNQRSRFADVAMSTRKQYDREDVCPASHMEKRQLLQCPKYGCLYHQATQIIARRSYHQNYKRSRERLQIINTRRWQLNILPYL